MAKQYRVTFSVRLSNLLLSTLVRLGLPVGLVYLLTVRGRKSGKPITTPIAIVVHEGKRYLVAAFGVVSWVRNLRAAGGEATITRSRRTEKIHAIELPPEAAALIFREAVRAGGGGAFVRQYQNVTADSSLEEFEREGLTRPVFLLQSVM